MAYSYQQFRPVDAFRSVVDAYWINRPGGAGSAPSDRVLPDGCIDLIFRGGDGAGLFSSALIERPIYFDDPVPAWFVGVRFRPAMARAILDIEPVDCRDRDIPAAMIDRRFAALEDELQDCASPEQALVQLKRRIDARLMQREHCVAPTRVRTSLSLLERGVDVRKVAYAVGIAERSLHRDLVRWTGLAPKSMARILRMQRTVTAIRAGRTPLADLALRMGYADQAHMTRELTELAGFTPSEIAPARNRRAVRNLQDAA
jgi:AraC-like DNA-binding protein